MTKIYKTAFAALIATGLFSVMPAFSADPPSGGKTAGKEVGREVKEAVEAIKEYSAEQRDDAVKKGKAVLDDLDARIERMKLKIEKNWDRMDESARKKASASLEAIQRERIKAAEWYGSMKQSSAGAWEEVKKGFVESYEALHDSFDKAAERF